MTLVYTAMRADSNLQATVLHNPDDTLAAYTITLYDGQGFVIDSITSPYQEDAESIANYLLDFYVGS